MAPPKRRRTGDKGQAASLEIRVQRFTRRFAAGGVPLFTGATVALARPPHLPHEPAPHCRFPDLGYLLGGAVPLDRRRPPPPPRAGAPPARGGGRRGGRPGGGGARPTSLHRTRAP